MRRGEARGWRGAGRRAGGRTWLTQVTACVTIFGLSARKNGRIEDTSCATSSWHAGVWPRQHRRAAGTRSSQRGRCVYVWTKGAPAECAACPRRFCGGCRWRLRKRWGSRARGAQTASGTARATPAGWPAWPACSPRLSPRTGPAAARPLDGAAKRRAPTNAPGPGEPPPPRPPPPPAGSAHLDDVGGELAVHGGDVVLEQQAGDGADGRGDLAEAKDVAQVARKVGVRVHLLDSLAWAVRGEGNDTRQSQRATKARQLAPRPEPAHGADPKPRRTDCTWACTSLDGTCAACNTCSTRARPASSGAHAIG